MLLLLQLRLPVKLSRRQFTLYSRLCPGSRVNLTLMARRRCTCHIPKVAPPVTGGQRLQCRVHIWALASCSLSPSSSAGSAGRGQLAPRCCSWANSPRFPHSCARGDLAPPLCSRSLSVTCPRSGIYICTPIFFYLASNYTHMLPFYGEDVTAINLTTGKAFHFLSSSS